MSQAAPLQSIFRQRRGITASSKRQEIPLDYAAFVTKVNSDGSQLAYSTFLGDLSMGNGIAVDASGNAYVTGQADFR